jgi:hypothetical protein
MILSSKSICLRSSLAIDSFTHTNSERVPHVRTSVRGLIKTGDPDFLQKALTRATCAAFIKESRMKSREAKKLDRKSGGSPSKVCLFLYPERGSSSKSPMEIFWFKQKAVEGLRPSFSAHVRWCERGAPFCSWWDRRPKCNLYGFVSARLAGRRAFHQSKSGVRRNSRISANLRGLLPAS